MKGEVSNLKAGIYHSDDGSMLCKICRSDYGIHVEIADLDGNIFYATTIDENGKAKFEFGNITDTMIDDQRKDENGQD